LEPATDFGSKPEAAQLGSCIGSLMAAEPQSNPDAAVRKSSQTEKSAPHCVPQDASSAKAAVPWGQEKQLDAAPPTDNYLDEGTNDGTAA